MDLVMVVSINGIEKEEVLKTKVGRRTVQDSEALSLSEPIHWYAEFSAGTPSFREVDQISTLNKEAEHNAK